MTSTPSTPTTSTTASPTAFRPWRSLRDDERRAAVSPIAFIGGELAPHLDAYRTRSVAALERARALGALHRRFAVDDARALPAVELVLPAVAASTHAPGAPLLVYIHGGYWQRLSAIDSMFAADGCLSRGIAFASVDYTLAPHTTVAAIVDECIAAVDRLRADAPSLGVDPARIVVAGSSAGGQLTTMVGLDEARRRLAGDARPPLRGLVTMSGVHELEPLIGTPTNDALGLDAATARSLSPLLASREDLAALAPTVAVVGDIESDEFKRQTAEFAARVREAGATCDDFVVAGRHHFDIVFELVDPGTRLGAATLSMLESPPGAR